MWVRTYHRMHPRIKYLTQTLAFADATEYACQGKLFLGCRGHTAQGSKESCRHSENAWSVDTVWGIFKLPIHCHKEVLLVNSEVSRRKHQCSPRQRWKGPNFVKHYLARHEVNRITIRRPPLGGSRRVRPPVYPSMEIHDGKYNYTFF